MYQLYVVLRLVYICTSQEVDVFIPTMDPILSVGVILGIHFALMREIALEVCQYLRNDMNTCSNSIVSIGTMCLALEATQ